MLTAPPFVLMVDGVVRLSNDWLLEESATVDSVIGAFTLTAPLAACRESVPPAAPLVPLMAELMLMLRSATRLSVGEPAEFHVMPASTLMSPGVVLPVLA